jgi:uncharacterized protein YpbB
MDPTTKDAAMAEQTEDLLNGYAEIGAYLKMTDRQVEYMVQSVPGFPVFGIGRRKMALKSRLDAWFTKQAEQRRPEGGDDRGGE